MSTLTEPGPPPTVYEPVAPTPARTRGRLPITVLVTIVVGTMFLATIVAVAQQSDNAAAPDPAEVVVRPDQGSDIASGNAEDLVPSTIRLEPGQDIVLRNDDWRIHTLGDLTAERGQTVRQTFPTEGRYITSTSLRFDGRVTILVEDTSR